MSLVNNLLNVPTVTDETGGYLKKYTVGLSDLKKGGAFTTVDIILDVMPAGSVVLLSRVKDSTAVAGTSFSAATARLYFGATALGSGTLDVFDAVGTADGTDAITDITGAVSPSALDATTNLIMRVTSTGGNLSATTSGSIDAYIVWKILL